MSIGYACLAVGVPGSKMKSVIQKNATPEKLKEIIENNLQALDVLLDYNIQNEIHMFRISSDIIPFGSSPVNQLNWRELFQNQLAALGEKAMDNKIRLSMHPGQYTVLNSPDEGVFMRAVEDLVYHCKFMDALALPASHKMILHIGGVYGDKMLAMERFVKNYAILPESVKKRLVIENDDRSYTIEDVLQVSNATGAPVVFDNLHHHLNSPTIIKTQEEWILECKNTWKSADGNQKTHYSQQAEGGRPGSHSATIEINTFMEYCKRVERADLDIMLEVKDKNVSALKCMLSTAKKQRIEKLEKEWGKYKYKVMEHDLNTYRTIRELLKDKKEYPAVAMFSQIEQAMGLPVESGSAVNAAQHVWGYFRKEATEKERKSFQTKLEKCKQDINALAAMKKFLFNLAIVCDEKYLLESYYFEL